MQFGARSKPARKVLVGLLAMAMTLLIAGTAASPATASESTVQSGSGTVSNPWVPPRNAHTTCQTTGIYGNYSIPEHKHLDKFADLPHWTYIVVRYITSDGRSADVYWVNGKRWGFVLTSCFVFT